jgi:hypothetical protein
MNANNIVYQYRCLVADICHIAYSFAFHHHHLSLFYTTQLSKSTLLSTTWRRVASTDKGDVRRWKWWWCGQTGGSGIKTMSASQRTVQSYSLDIYRQMTESNGTTRYLCTHFLVHSPSLLLTAFLWDWWWCYYKFFGALLTQKWRQFDGCTTRIPVIKELLSDVERCGLYFGTPLLSLLTISFTYVVDLLSFGIRSMKDADLDRRNFVGPTYSDPMDGLISRAVKNERSSQALNSYSIRWVQRTEVCFC